MTKTCGKCNKKKLALQQQVASAPRPSVPSPSPLHFVTVSTVVCQGWPAYQYLGVLLSIRRSMDQVLLALN